MANITYPYNINDLLGDCVRFRFGKYTPPYNGSPPPAGTTSTYNPSVVFNTNEARVKDNIYLPMPSDIGSNITGTWGGKDITALAGAALNSVASPVTKFITGDANAKAGIQNLLTTQGLTSLVASVGEDALKALADKFVNLPGLGANLNVNDVLSLTSGTIINPNTELLYGGSALRQHGYTFKMVPTSQPEAVNMIKIVEAFKIAAAPKTNSQTIAGTKVTNFLELPDVVEVAFLTYDGTGLKESPHLPRYKTSAINSVSVDYVTEGNYASYRDGYPIGVSLTIALTELKLLFSDEIRDGKYR